MNDETKIQQYVLLAKGARGRALVDLITKATSEPTLFSFGELLDVPQITDLQEGEFAPYLHLLKMFCYGSWPQYKVESSGSALPEVNANQVLKLKQLTIVSLAISNKTIAQQTLMQQLDIPTVRELEDFIINECFYTGLVKGKMDQKQRTLQVHDVIGRDVRVEQLQELDRGLCDWLATSEGLLASIEQRIQFSSSAADAAKVHQTDLEARLVEAKRHIKTEMDMSLRDGGFMGMDDDGGMDYMDEDRVDRSMMMGGARGGERTERMSGRPKSRRR